MERPTAGQGVRRTDGRTVEAFLRGGGGFEVTRYFARNDYNSMRYGSRQARYARGPIAAGQEQREETRTTDKVRTLPTLPRKLLSPGGYLHRTRYPTTYRSHGMVR